VAGHKLVRPIDLNVGRRLACSRARAKDIYAFAIRDPNIPGRRQDLREQTESLLHRFHRQLGVSRADFAGSGEGGKVFLTQRKLHALTHAG